MPICSIFIRQGGLNMNVYLKAFVKPIEQMGDNVRKKEAHGLRTIMSDNQV